MPQHEPTPNPKKTFVLFLGIENVLLNTKKMNEVDKNTVYLASHGKSVDGKKQDEEQNKATLKALGVNNFSKQALSYIKKLREDVESRGYEFRISVSSTWRAHVSLKELIELLQLPESLKEYDFSKYIIGKTADHTKININWKDATISFELNRAELVETWVRSHPIDNFVVWDFDNARNCFTDLIPNNFVHVQGGELSESDVKKTLEILEVGPKPRNENLIDFSPLQRSEEPKDQTEPFKRVPIPLSKARLAELDGKAAAVKAQQATKEADTKKEADTTPKDTEAKPKDATATPPTEEPGKDTRPKVG